LTQSFRNFVGVLDRSVIEVVHGEVEHGEVEMEVRPGVDEGGPVWMEGRRVRVEVRLGVVSPWRW
jgi:hypothetical protein